MTDSKGEGVSEGGSDLPWSVSSSLTLGGRKNGRTTCVPISWRPNGKKRGEKNKMSNSRGKIMRDRRDKRENRKKRTAA